MQEMYSKSWPITPPETPEINPSSTDVTTCKPTKPLQDLDNSPKPLGVCSHRSQVCAWSYCVV